MTRSLRDPGLALALVALVACSQGETVTASRRSSTSTSATYVTSESCARCHAEEHAAWKGSHHDLAMQEATAENVLGDFDDVVFEHLGARTRFLRKDGDFLVETEGPGGERGEFLVRYTFGVEPLQQYLLELEGGRLQCLTVAWDTERGEWYSLYPDETHAPDDPLHWSGVYQNWNGMCADCHSTGLVKGYDPERDAFETTWEELDVACEACHGPGSEHVEWAERHDGSAVAQGANVGLTHTLLRNDRDAQIDSCAPCHSRRSRMVFDAPPGTPFLEAYRPELLVPGSYHADGQILDEVYVYGSFAQSAMHERGVACTDCHDPHSLELLAPGNALCAQCHSPYAPQDRFPTLVQKDYDSPEHHFHEEGSEAARCVSCHMPSKNYMVVDPRRDHSFRVPRPDLALEHGTPDACTSCHEEEGTAWCAEEIERFYGEERATHFTSAFARAQEGDPSAVPDLDAIARDTEQPSIVRATALDHLRRFGPVGVETGRALREDPDAWVRATAVRTYESMEPLGRIAELVDLLKDPSRQVRAEAARALAPARADIVQALAGDTFPPALEEWETAQRFSAEMPWPHLNLGAMYNDRGDTRRAVEEYKRALELDPYFLPAAFNLATLYNMGGRNLEAERVLRAAVERAPDEGQLHYSLGLLLSEVGRMPDAAGSLARAAELLPDNPRVLYNAGLALDRSGRSEEAEPLLLAANRLNHEDPDVLHALALFYEEQGEPGLALPYAEKLLELVPDAEAVVELAARLRESVRNP